MAGQPWAAQCLGQGTLVTVQVPRGWLACPGSALALAPTRYLCSCHSRSLGALKGEVSCFGIIRTLAVYMRSPAPGCMLTVAIMGTCPWPEAFSSAGSGLWVSVYFFR